MTNRRLHLQRDGRLNCSPVRLAIALGCPDWDVMLVGDGSGQGGWDMSGGWACCTLERHTDYRSVTWGGWNLCTIMLAELIAYQQALITYEAARGPAMRRHLGHGIRFLIITDNQATSGLSARGLVGEGVGGDTSSIWAGIRYLLGQSGSTATFRFAPRISTMLNFGVDQVAGRVRKEIGESTHGEVLIRKVLQPWLGLNPAK